MSSHCLSLGAALNLEAKYCHQTLDLKDNIARNAVLMSYQPLGIDRNVVTMSCEWLNFGIVCNIERSGKSLLCNERNALAMFCQIVSLDIAGDAVMMSWQHTILTVEAV